MPTVPVASKSDNAANKYIFLGHNTIYVVCNIIMIKTIPLEKLSYFTVPYLIYTFKKTFCFKFTNYVLQYAKRM